MLRKQTLISDWKSHYTKLKTQVTAGISDQWVIVASFCVSTDLPPCRNPILAYIEAARFIQI